MNLWSASLIYECPFYFEQEGWWFYTFSHVGQWAVLIKETLILLAWLIQAWRIRARSHSHTRVIAGQRHLLPSKTPSLKPGMLEDFYPYASYYSQNQAAVQPYLKSLKSIDIKMITYKLVLLVVPPGSQLLTHQNSAVLQIFQPWCAGT